MANRRKFVLALAGSFLLTFGLLPCLAGLLLNSGVSAIPVSYRDFLFRNIGSPAIVIEGGSSAVYSINPSELETHFNLPTVVAADFAGVPLDAKVSRLERLAKPGQYIIIALEWNYYVREDRDPAFSRRVFLELRHYYEDMDWYDKLHTLFFDVRPTDTFRALLTRLDFIEEPSEKARTLDFLRQLNVTPRGEVGERQSTRAADIQGSSCIEYIFETKGPELAASLGPLADRLAALQRKGVNILMTWPALAGEGCYNDKQFFETIHRNVVNLFTSRGIRVISTPDRSLIPSAVYRQDTFYHLTAEGAAKRTRFLIEDLDAAKAIPRLAELRATAPELAGESFRALETELALQRATRIDPVVDGSVTFGSPEAARFVAMGDGWYPEEEWGAWSRGEKSSIYLRTDRPCRMKIDAGLFGTDSPVMVDVNGRETEWSADKWIDLPGSADLIHVQFHYSDLHSAVELGLSDDFRRIRFGPRTLSFSCSAGAASLPVN